MTSDRTGNRIRQRWLWRLLPVAVIIIQFGGIRWSGRWPQQQRWQHGADWEPLPNEVSIIGYIVAMIGPVALFWLRRHPRSVIAVTAVSTVAYYLLGLGSGPVFLSVLVALGGWAGLLRGERTEAARRAIAAEAGRRAETQRLAIAQELHDILAHHISLISVQSGVALHLIDERPEQTRQALTAIKGASKEALSALRGALDTLRDQDSAAPRAPAGGLEQLNALIANVRAAGVTVTLDHHGQPRPLPAPVSLAALRIIQESLTNVLRHSSADHVRVRVEFEDAAVVVSVTDNGVGQVPVAGNGLTGINERARSLGGTSRFGPVPAGGFEVSARLPDTVAP